MNLSKTPTKPALKNIKFEPNGYCRICNTPSKGVLCSDKECRRKHLREWERSHRYNKMVESIDETRSTHIGVEGVDYVECSICGFRHHRQITTHLKYHEISVDEYRSMYPNVAVIISAAGFQKGEANPAYDHGGKFSPWSDKFIHKTEGSVDAAKKKAKATVTANGNHNNTVSFYVNKGMTEQQARQAVTERQTTFSKAKCVEKYGEEGGIARWEDRQAKWMKTMDGKTDAEKLEISRKKRYKVGPTSSIEKRVVDELSKNFDIQTQFAIKSSSSTWKFYDIRVGRKIIEVNGDFWHMNPIKFNECDVNPYFKDKTAGDIWKADDAKIQLAEQNDFDVLVIWEHDIKTDYDGTIAKCVNFLSGDKGVSYCKISL